MEGELRLFSAAAFLSSFLLFSLELIVVKLLLPRFGGAAYVWTASAAVFQGLLLGAYAFARAALARWGARYFKLHLSLLALPLLWLPLSLGEAPGAAADGPHPSWRLVCALLVSIGAPFFVLATTAPVLQDWWRRSQRGGGYHLYAASNFGALAALLVYPTLIEPALTARAQALAWAGLYAVFAALHLFFRAAAAAAAPVARAESSREERLVWLLLSAGASAALYASTSLLTLDFASVPLLWAGPLALYLLTFVATFKRRPWYPAHPSALLAGFIVLWLCAVLGVVLSAGGVERWQIARRLWVLNKLSFYAAGLFLICLLSHRALAVSRPPDERSGDFYVWIALGGWAGASLVGLLMPALARHFALPELDWALAGALALAGLLRSERVLLAQGRLDAGPPRGVTLALAFVGALGVGFYASHSPLFGSGTLVSLRNFYGFYRVGEDGGLRRFHHGNTVHGLQRLDPARQDEPLLYYHRASPVGEALAGLGPRAKNVAAFGLGAGVVAAYARAGQTWTFFELDPDVIALARSYFTFLARAKGRMRVVAGDARLAFAREMGEPAVDLLIIDVFASGAIPVHLLTREALALYLARLAPDGAILIHVTNRFLDLRAVLADLAADAGLSGLAQETGLDAPPGADKAYTSWVALAREPATLAPLEKSWTPLSRYARGRRAWTDDYAPLWSALAR